jgi:hypothetical protein
MDFKDYIQRNQGDVKLKKQKYQRMVGQTSRLSKENLSWNLG